MADEMHLTLFFLPVGRMEGAWRRPTSRAEELWGLDLPRLITQQCEAAKLDAVFFADFIHVYNLGAMPQSGGGYEPLTLMSAMAAVTSRIGLIATISTTFVEPYNAARYLASIDHLSGGRAGWNIVTSVAGEEHFGMQLPPKAQRYRRAHEHVAIVKALWDCWADDAVVMDRESGQWCDPERVRPINFDGEFFKLTGAGPLPAHRSPQGWPVLVQAGQSDDGVDFAATHAEVVFTSQNDLERSRQFTAAVKASAQAKGRSPRAVNVLPGIMPLVARTERAARDLKAELDDRIDLERGRSVVSMALLGAALDDVDYDEPVPLDRVRDPEEVAAQAGAAGSEQGRAGLALSRYRNYHSMVARGVSLRELIHATESTGHFSLVGTASYVADVMEAWFRAGACDGFTLTVAGMPEPFDNVCEMLIPELQRRGVFRREYRGRTLRDHLGLARPPA